MEQGAQSFDVLYERQDDHMSFFSGMRKVTDSPGGLQTKKTYSCSRALSVHWKSFFLMLFILVATALVLHFLLNNKSSVCQETADELSVLPDMVNLTLAATTDNSFTVTWERPEENFDYYLIDVSDDHNNGIGHSRNGIAGSCANGTIIHPDMTQVTCLQLKTCSNVNFRISTHITGPPERISHGATLHDIFIPAEDPVPPVDITVDSYLPSETLLRWQPSEQASGTTTEYLVLICDTFHRCAADENVRSCTEYNTSKVSLKFDSAADTTYCVMVYTIVHCDMVISRSHPAAKLIRTPLLALPEVRNLHLVSVVERAVTLKWDKPQTHFDYYCIDTAAGREYQDQDTTPRIPGSCENSTIIHPNQNQVTCGNLQACANVTFKVKIYRQGPPELSSLATTVRDVFIPGQDLDSPRNISIDIQADGSIVLQWEPPAKVEGVLGEYIVRVCNSYRACVPTDTMCNCTEYGTSATMLEINDTSAAYCVLVTATSKCGADVLQSRPYVKEVLIPSREHPKKSTYKWVAWRGSTVPENAVPGGEDTYVCRAIHDGKFTPGKLFTPHSKCYISYGGFEHGYDEYEALVIEDTPAGSGAVSSC